MNRLDYQTVRTMKNEEKELTLYVTKISNEYNTKNFIRVIASIPKESLWIELPKDGIPEKVDIPRGRLMEKFWKEMQPFIQDSVKKQEEITNVPVENYRIKYNKEFLSTGSIRTTRKADFHIPLTDDEIYFFNSVMTMSNFF